MGATKLRAGLLLLAPLLYGLIAYSAQAAADRAFDARMLRDRGELSASLERHGATPQQVADVLAFEAAVARNVSGLVQTTGSAVIGTLMFLGVTLGGLLAWPRSSERGRPQGG
jgi:hypothetical protein